MLAVSLSRQSKANEDQDESISIAFQQRRAREEAARHGDEVVAEFFDIDVSGGADSKHKRVGLHEMMAFLRAHPDVRRVYIYNVSRFARDTLYTLEMVRELRNLKQSVELKSASENIDDPTILTVIASFAERERVQLSNNVAYAARESARKGRITQSIPFGYRRRNGEVVIHEPEAAIVRRIFRDFAAGRTTGEIIVDLNREGVRTPGGVGAWWHQNVRRILRIRTYVGEIAISETRDPHGRARPALIAVGNHAPIVERDLWDAVQRRLASGRQSRRATKAAPPWLAGFTMCAACGDKLYVMNQKGQPTDPYWIFKCATYHKANQYRRPSPCPGQKIAHYPPFDAIARDTLAAVIADRIPAADAHARAVAALGKATATRADELRATIADKERRLRTAYMEYEDENLTRDEWLERKKALEAERDAAAAELDLTPLPLPVAAYETAHARLSGVEHAIPLASDDKLRALLTEMGAVATVDVRGKAVAWSFAEPFASLLVS